MMSAAMQSSNDTEGDCFDVNSHSSLARYITIAYLSFMAVLGTLGNVLVILTISKTKKFHRLTYILIANLSVVGLLECVIIIPSHIINIIHVGRIHSDAFLCELEGYLNFVLTLAMIGNSNAIALNRYVVVNKQQTGSVQAGQFRTTALILIMLWLFPCIISLSSLPFTGYHDYILDCFFLMSPNAYWYVIAVVSAPGIITTLLISVCYSLILRKVRKSRLKVTATMTQRIKVNEEQTSTWSEAPSDIEGEEPSQISQQPSTSTGICCNTNDILNDVRQNIAESMANRRKTYKLKGGKFPTRVNLQQVSQLQVAVTSSSQSLMTGSRSPLSGSQTALDKTTKRRTRLASVKLQQEMRLTLQLLLVFLFFCCLYLPICVVHILHVAVTVSPDVWLTLFTLALSFSTTTWILYGVLNIDFRRAYSKILHCKK